MGASKTKKYKEKESSIAAYGKALSHPARITILNLLAEHKSRSCGEIVKELPLSQSTVSQHLKELKDAGLVKVVKGSYVIHVKEWKNAKNSFKHFFKSH